MVLEILSDINKIWVVNEEGIEIKKKKNRDKISFFF